MLKVIGLIKRREDMTHEEFVKYWEEEHVPKALEFPKLKKYVTSPAVSPDRYEWEGVGELYFESVEDITATLESDQGKKVRADEDNFIRTVDNIVVSENVHYSEIE